MHITIHDTLLTSLYRCASNGKLSLSPYIPDAAVTGEPPHEETFVIARGAVCLPLRPPPHLRGNREDLSRNVM